MTGPLSVERVLDILGFLADHRRGAPLAQVVRATGVPKTSAFDLVAGLLALGYVTRTESGQYLLGRAAYALAGRMLENRELVDLAIPSMEVVVAATGETCLLGVPSPERDTAMYVQKVESPNPVRYTVPIGDRKPLYCTAIGKLVLAHLSDREVNDYLKHHPLKSMTRRTITDSRLLRAELKRIRASGISVADRERVEDLCAIAVPVFNHTGAFVAGLMIGGPAARINAAMKAHIRTLQDAARQLSIVVPHVGADATARVEPPLDPEPRSPRTHANRPGRAK